MNEEEWQALGACWLIAAIQGGEAALDVDLVSPLGRGVRLCAWRIGEGGDWSGLESALRRAVEVVRPARGAVLALGTGEPFGSTLLGITAASVERRARRRWRHRPVLSRRLREALERMPHDPDALELRARARPREAGLWWAWGSALRRSRRGAEAVPVLRRAVVLQPAPAQGALLQELAGVLLAEGEPAQAEWFAGQALAQAEDPRAELLARRALAAAWLDLGRHGPALAALAPLQDLALASGERALALGCARMRVAGLAALGRFAEAREVGALALLPWQPSAFPSHDTTLAEAGEAVELWSAAALALQLAGSPHDARAAWSAMGQVAEGYGLRHLAGRARLGVAWSSLVGGDVRAAASDAEALLADTAVLEEEVRVSAAYVLAECRFHLEDTRGARAALDLVERGARPGARLDLRRAGAPLVWMTASLRARLAVRDGEPAEALSVLLDAVARADHEGSEAQDPWAPADWLDAHVPLRALAAEVLVAGGRDGEALLHADRAGLRGLQGRRVGVGMVPAPTEGDVDRGRSLLREAGVDTLVLQLGVQDLLVFQEGPETTTARVVGVAPLLRRLVAEIAGAPSGSPSMDDLLAALGHALAPALSGVGTRPGPLALLPHGPLRDVPWELLPVHGQALGARRPIAQLPSLAWVVPGAPADPRGRTLLGPGVADAPLADATDLLDAIGPGWTLVVADGGPDRLHLRGGPLHAADVLARALPKGTVLLATGRAPGARGHALAEALLAAGAETVVAPATAIGRDESAAVLTELAGALSGGAALLPALRAACRAVAPASGAGGRSSAPRFRVLTRSIRLMTDAASG